MGKRGPKKGVPKTPGSGRKPGSLNKKTLQVMEILHEHNFNVIEEFLFLYDKTNNMRGGLPIAIKCLTELASYVYPKRSHSEHSGVNGEPILIDRPLVELPDQELLELIPEATQVILENAKRNGI